MISTTVKPMRKSRFALMLLLLIAPKLGVSQSLSPLWTLAEEMGKGFMSSDLPTEIFKWINSEPSPAEKAKKAKPKVVALYTDLELTEYSKQPDPRLGQALEGLWKTVGLWIGV